MNSSGTNAVKTTAERSNLRNLVQIGMLGAVSVVLMMFEIPLFFAPSFYKIDLSEIPVGQRKGLGISLGVKFRF